MVTRENVSAITGSSAISTAADAVIDVASHDNHRGRKRPYLFGPPGHVHRAAAATSNSAAVAPNVRMKPALRTSRGSTTVSRTPATAIACHGALR